MTDLPERYTEADDLSMDELVEVVKARRRGDEPPRFETTAYRQHRADVLREGGLIEEAEAEQPAPIGDLADLSVADHFRRIRKGNR